MGIVLGAAVHRDGSEAVACGRGAPMSTLRQVARRVRDGVRRRSPLERAIARSSMSALSRRARVEVRAFQVRCALPVLPGPGYGRITPAPGCAVYVHADTVAIDV